MNVWNKYYNLPFSVLCEGPGRCRVTRCVPSEKLCCPVTQVPLFISHPPPPSCVTGPWVEEGLRNYWFSSWIHIWFDSQGLCCGFAFPLGICRRWQPGNDAPEVLVGLGPVCAALWPLFLKKFWPWCQERCPSSCGDYFPPVKAYSLQDFIIKHFICLSLLRLFRTHFLCSWE